MIRSSKHTLKYANAGKIVWLDKLFKVVVFFGLFNDR